MPAPPEVQIETIELALSHPDLAGFRGLLTQRARPGHDGLAATFASVATVPFDDGETAVITDGFFSRRGKVAVAARRIVPDRRIVRHALDQLAAPNLAAVGAAHSHYDHAPHTSARANAWAMGAVYAIVIERRGRRDEVPIGGPGRFRNCHPVAPIDCHTWRPRPEGRTPDAPR